LGLVPVEAYVGAEEFGVEQRWPLFPELRPALVAKKSLGDLQIGGRLPPVQLD